MTSESFVTVSRHCFFQIIWKLPQLLLIMEFLVRLLAPLQLYYLQIGLEGSAALRYILRNCHSLPTVIHFQKYSSDCSPDMFRSGHVRTVPITAWTLNWASRKFVEVTGVV